VHRTLHGEAVARLRERIVEGSLPPGMRLNEKALCAELGVSRTPLREALRMLAAEGLIELSPHRGAAVAPLTVETVRDVFAVMGALEALAGETACRQASAEQLAEIRALHYEMRAHHARRDLGAYFRLNQAIHLAIVGASGNAVLAATYRSLNANALRAQYLANLSQERWDAAVAEHDEILAALERRDGTRLQAVLRSHLGAKMLAVLAAIAPAAAAANEA